MLVLGFLTQELSIRLRVKLWIPYIKNLDLLFKRITIIERKLSDYSTCCINACLRVWYTKYMFTRSVHQPPTYMSGAPLKY
jgi:hypothetical protein